MVENMDEAETGTFSGPAATELALEQWATLPMKEVLLALVSQPRRFELEIFIFSSKLGNRNGGELVDTSLSVDALALMKLSWELELNVKPGRIEREEELSEDCAESTLEAL